MESVHDTVIEQEQYVQRLEAEGFDYGLVVGEAFVCGMRDVGYKSTATAINELIDNAIQAGARNINVVFGYDDSNQTEKKPQRIAVVDDGHGMSAGMIRASVIWGGTHRAGSRELFGKYGFGLPSSCVSQGPRFEVYSRLEGTEWYSVSIDLDDISEGKCIKDGKICVPQVQAKTPPTWIWKSGPSAQGIKNIKHGTVVLIDRLDRHSWKKSETMERELLQNIGVTYRNYMREVTIYVNGKAVEKVDPLFLDETGRFYDAQNGIRAEALDPIEIEVKDSETKRPLGVVKVRFSYLPLGFQNETGKPRGKLNERFKITDDYNGFLVLRAGRLIDVVTKTPWKISFTPYTRNVKLEIDFPPALDEEFSITTSKQQVVLTDRIWDILEEKGLKRTWMHMWYKYRDAAKKHKAEKEQLAEGQLRPSESVMADTRKYRTRQPQHSPEQIQAANERLQREIDTRIRQTGKSRETIIQQIEAEQKNSPYRVGFERIPEGSFYRPETVGSQVHVFINEAHSFCKDVYRGPDITPRVRTALELLLLVQGECELNTKPEIEEFYRTERREWSSRLTTALKLYDLIDPIADAETEASAQAECD